MNKLKREGGATPPSNIAPPPPAGNIAPDRPAVVQNADGRLEVFARGTDGAVWHTWKTEKNSNSWIGRWFSLGNSIIGGPLAGRNQDGRLEVFVRGTDSMVWHRWQIRPNGDWIDRWFPLEGLRVDTMDTNLGFRLAQNTDGRFELFATEDRDVYRTWQIEPNGNWAGGWRGVSRYPDFVVGRNQDGRLEMFAKLVTIVERTSQRTPGSSDTWTGWRVLNNDFLVGQVYTVANNADGRLEVFISRNGEQRLWHTWQTQLNDNWINHWFPIEGDIATSAGVEVIQNEDGRLEAFAKSLENKIIHTWQTEPNGEWVDGWATRGGEAIGGFSVAQNPDGRLEIFATGRNNTIWNTWQTAPNNGWSF